MKKFFFRLATFILFLSLVGCANKNIGKEVGHPSADINGVCAAGI